VKDAGLRTFGIADLPGFVNLLPGEAKLLSTGLQSVAVSDSFGRPVATSPHSWAASYPRRAGG